MKQYAIYRVYLSESQEKDLFLKETDGKSILEHAQEHFGSLFSGNTLAIYKSKDGENTTYPNDILAKRDDVIVLRLNNVQFKKLYKRRESAKGLAPSYEEVKEESNPYSYIIIDNRPGICLMAIQISSAWGSSSDTVRNLLQECLHHKLVDEYGLDIMINAKIHPTKYWEFVKHQVNDNQDRIKKIEIDVINPKKIAPVNQIQMVRPKGMMKSMSDFVEKSKALRATFSMDADNCQPIEMEQEWEDWTNIMEVCAHNLCTVSVQFEKLGLYKCDQEVMALYHLDDEALNAFVHGSPLLDEEKPEGEYALTRWLDNIRKQTKDYKDAEQTRKKPKRKPKK